MKNSRSGPCKSKDKPIGPVKKLIGYITFVNQPLKQKFLLFATGVLVWFLVIFTISIATLVSLKSRSDSIVGHLIPHDRVSQKIIRKLQGLNIDGRQLVAATGRGDVIKITKDSGTRLQDIRAFLNALGRGGRVNDYSRSEDKFVESFTVRPADREGQLFVKRMAGQMDDVSARLDRLSSLKMEGLKSGKGGGVEAAFKNYDAALSNAVALSNKYSAGISRAYAAASGKIGADLRCSFTALSAILLLATALLVVFTFSISVAVIKPIKAVIGQIRSLSKGEIDISKKISINTHDEIGRLALEFNGLMETIDSMTKFKKIIEEDETLEDVYSRLGAEFRYFGLEDYTVFEIANSQNKMKAAYPPESLVGELSCNPEVFENCLLCRAKKTGHKISSLQYPGICKYFAGGERKEHICVPLMVGGTAGGVVQFIFNKEDLSDYRLSAIEGWTRAAEQYMKESIPVIEAKRLMNTLRDSALKDSLTGLHNRRFLQEYTESLVAGSLRRGKSIGLIMGDIDYFKQVNDVYGHNAGDAILKETAEVLRRSVRAADLVIRFGGEEFLVVLIDVTQDESFKIAEKIRETMEDVKLKVAEGFIKKTISLGVSEFPADTESFWQSIKFADVALYEAKRSGRNKSVRFTKEMWKDEQF